MNQAPSKARVLLALLGVAATVSCGGRPPDMNDPGVVALQLFALAADAPEQEQLESLFDPDPLSSQVVSLLEALDMLADSAPPDLLRVETAPGADEAFVDLTVELSGGGRAGYSVKLRRLESDDWRISWFQGPGVEWPRLGRRGAGLTTSAPPESRSDGW